jgi:hypothetical protein
MYWGLDFRFVSAGQSELLPRLGSLLGGSLAWFSRWWFARFRSGFFVALP